MKPSRKAALRSPEALVAGLKREAQALGFDAVGVARADAPWPAGERLRAFIAASRHGTMDWMESTAARRSHPQALWPEARTAIMLGLNYAPADDPLAALARGETAAISVYAGRRDYHDVIKQRLKTLARWLAGAADCAVKVFVDTAPLMEKPLAQAAGLGWQGKHTNLVSRDFGSWLFLGAILTDADLPADAAEEDHCGACRACLDVCPTSAFPAPYQLDARRCLAYLTIEHEGQIPEEFRAPMGNRVFGCDDCLAVCPWNKFARVAADVKMAVRETLCDLSLGALAALDDARFRALFAGTPIKRTGRDRFVRNVLIAIGNSRTPALAQSALGLIDDPSPVVRGAAAWALSRLLDPTRFEEVKLSCRTRESDADVRREWGL
jgi:epoxyqueuosine reductase